MPLDLPLEYQYRAADPKAGAPWLLVLMHGVGSNDDDLFGLAPYVPPQFHVLSLRAPYAIGPDSYAWFQFGVKPDGERIIDTAQELASRKLVAQSVRAAAEQLGVPAARVVVGGFSQGGIMALTILLTQPSLLHAVLVMHSRTLPEALTDAVSGEALLGKQAWVSHGLQDNVIPLASAHATRDLLATLPVALTYREFPGAHEIRPAELQGAMAWLGSLA
jgi:phospholipase/carboxylesterase